MSNKPLYVIYAKSAGGYKWYNTTETLHGDYPTGWSQDLSLIPEPKIFSIEYKWKYNEKMPNPEKVKSNFFVNLFKKIFNEK